MTDLNDSDTRLESVQGHLLRLGRIKYLKAAQAFVREGIFWKQLVPHAIRPPAQELG